MGKGVRRGWGKCKAGLTGGGGRLRLAFDGVPFSKAALRASNGARSSPAAPKVVRYQDQSRLELVFPPGRSPSLPGQTPPNANLPNGVTGFPGGFPLYRKGVLIGAVGSSGDGVDQDGLAGASGAGEEFAPPEKIRADQFTSDGARLPFAKFPRNPDL